MSKPWEWKRVAVFVHKELHIRLQCNFPSDMTEKWYTILQTFYLVMRDSYKAIKQSFSSFTSKYSTRPSLRKSSKLRISWVSSLICLWVTMGRLLFTMMYGLRVERWETCLLLWDLKIVWTLCCKATCHETYLALSVLYYLSSHFMNRIGNIMGNLKW